MPHNCEQVVLMSTVCLKNVSFDMFQAYAAQGNHRRCVSIIAEMEVLFLNSTCYKLCSYPSQASNVAVDSAAYGALLTACALSPDASPPHDWALSTLETMQVCV